MLKILITGPECSGKTSLSTALARQFKSPLIPELARAYLTMRSTKYNQQDLRDLATNQLALEDCCMGLTAPYLFIDTSMLVLQIWSRYRYGKIDSFIRENFASRNYDLCFLCEPVEPYIADTLRENPADRWSLFYLYLKELWLKKHKPKILKGNAKERFQAALAHIGELG